MKFDGKTILILDYYEYDEYSEEEDAEEEGDYNEEEETEQIAYNPGMHKPKEVFKPMAKTLKGKNSSSEFRYVLLGEFTVTRAMKRFSSVETRAKRLCKYQIGKKELDKLPEQPSLNSLKSLPVKVQKVETSRQNVTTEIEGTSLAALASLSLSKPTMTLSSLQNKSASPKLTALTMGKSSNSGSSIRLSSLQNSSNLIGKDARRSNPTFSLSSLTKSAKNLAEPIQRLSISAPAPKEQSNSVLPSDYAEFLLLKSPKPSSQKISFNLL
jgi:hypothetical protein